jgi:hypothetical protein
VCWEYDGERDTYLKGQVLTAILTDNTSGNHVHALIRTSRDAETGQLCRTGSLANSRSVGWNQVHAGVDAVLARHATNR